MDPGTGKPIVKAERELAAEEGYGETRRQGCFVPHLPNEEPLSALQWRVPGLRTLAGTA